MFLAERVLSGPGLVNLYRAIVKADNRRQKISSQKILPNARWLTAAPDCRRALSLFCVIMGRLAAIWRSISTFGGVFIGGWYRAALP